MGWRDVGDLPWQADRPLSEEAAAAIIRATFPQVDTTGVRHLGYGWEFDVFVTTDRWVFRFPRRQDWANGFDREAQVLRLVAPALAPAVVIPHVELLGSPAPGFPYTFAGHRLIEGVAAHMVADDLFPTLGRDLGAFLGALHSIPLKEGRAAGLREVDEEWVNGARDWRTQVIADAQRLRDLDSGVSEAITSLQRETVPDEYFRVPLSVIHSDLVPEHVIVDPKTGKLQGVIDWTDAMIGDAARDFVFIATWRGWQSLEDVLRHYPCNVDADFRGRIRWMARLLSVFWLDVALKTGRDFERHRRGVRNVFAPNGDSSRA